jgi:hypothetical protein
MTEAKHMKNATQAKLTLFAENAQIMKQSFSWQNELTRRLAALLYAQENKPVDCEAIRQCHTL